MNKSHIRSVFELASLFVHINFIEQQKTKILALCLEPRSVSKLKLPLCFI